MSAFGVFRAALATCCRVSQARALHTSFSSHAFSKFLMPAMSPTMTEGGLATWKVQEGQSFSSGDVLLEIETDKATMDVEAQDDGVMAKIVVQAGEKNVSVGKMIAILAEEGDDLSKAESEVGPEASNKEALSESLPSSSSASFQELSTRQVSSSLAAEISSASPSASMLPNQSHHAKPDPPMFPSVLRMLNERKMSPHDAKSKIKGTGMRGMITKGDLLVFLGQAKTPTGTYKDEPAGISDLGGSPSGKLTKTIGQEATKPLTAQALRSAILDGMTLNSRSYQSLVASKKSPMAAKDALDDALSDYSKSSSSPTVTSPSRPKRDWLEGLV